LLAFYFPRQCCTLKPKNTKNQNTSLVKIKVNNVNYLHFENRVRYYKQKIEKSV